jgi:hypothetical protein
MKILLKIISWILFFLFCFIEPIWSLEEIISLNGVSSPFLDILIIISRSCTLCGVIFVFWIRKKLKLEDYLIMGVPFLLWLISFLVVFRYVIPISWVRAKGATNFFLVEPMIIDFLIAIYFGTKIFMMTKKMEELKTRKISKMLCGIILVLVVFIPLAVPWMGE